MKYNTKTPPATVGIGKRIGRLVAASVFGAIVTVSTSLAFFQVTRDIAARKSNLETTGFVLASGVTDALLAKNRQAALSTFRAASRIRNIRSITVFDPDNHVFASMGQAIYLESDLFTARQSNLALLLKGTMPIAVDIIKGGEKQGRLVMLADISDVRQAFLSTLFTTCLAAAFAGLVAMLASIPLQRRIVTPVVNLTAAMSAIRHSRNYNRDIVEKAAEGEVAILVKNFNGLMSDIRFRDESLKRIAYFDHLTGLASRASFDITLQEFLVKNTVEQVQKGAVASIIIHGFRHLNDAFGQTIGNAILLNVAAVLRDKAGPNSIVARRGGNEFAILFENVSSMEEAELALAEVQSAFYAPLKILHLELNITLTCGLLVLEQLPAASAETSLHAAALALASAKAMGQGRAMIYRPEMADAMKRETQLDQDLRHAIGNGEMQLHYQIQYDFKSGLVTGFESLARWKHPERGFISPTLFIPAAERNGMIVMLGDWVLRDACRQGRVWLDAGHVARKISVNVSPAQLLEAGFTTKVKAALDEHDFPAAQLCLEITESLFLGTTMTTVQQILKSLSELGVQLALDDFGTGYSSLGYLAKLPFHTIKIDRSFVTGADTASRRREILSSIIGMCHSLGMSVVAEGAETPGELKMLEDMNADQVQGFCIAKPVAASDLLAKVAEVEGKSHQVKLIA